MTTTYHNDIYQGTDEWLELRRGILTASEMKLIMTPTLKAANNDKSRSHLYELLAQRIGGFVEDGFTSDDMERGHIEEVFARDEYSKNFAPVTECGFITRDDFVSPDGNPFTIGYSPDGLVGDDGLIEIKSRRQKYQIETIINGFMPDDYLLQVQTGLLVTGRKWLDFVSYCGGHRMVVIRHYQDADIMDKIVACAGAFEDNIAAAGAKYDASIRSLRTVPTERRSLEIS